jgi:hypothetical protein
VSDPCTVLIAALDLLPALQEKAESINGEILTFSDSEALRALDVIVKRRPEVVALERQFAATPRGAALINRIKADPTLTGSELRVISHDSDYVRVVPRPARKVDLTADTVDEVPVITAVPVAPLDQRGTRRAQRFKIAGETSVLLDGNGALLVDLSEVGAQVVSPTVLKPNQRVRVALTDDHGAIRFNGVVAWASFEIPPNRGPLYRAGVNFVDADGNAVGAFCMRHKQ